MINKIGRGSFPYVLLLEGYQKKPDLRLRNSLYRGSTNTVDGVREFGRLVPSRYLSVFWDERRLGIRLRRARGVMGREEGKAIFLLPFPSWIHEGYSWEQAGFKFRVPYIRVSLWNHGNQVLQK